MGSADACGRSLTALQDDLHRLFLNARVFYPDMQFKTGTGLLYGHRFMLYARASDTLLKKLNSPLDDSLLAPALEYVYTARPGAPLTAYELLAEEWYPSLTLNDAAEDTDHLRTLSADLLAARNRRPLSDLTLVAENGQRFYVHRGLLAVRVPFFRRLLESVNVPAFFLPVTPHVTELLLSYVYGAVIDLELASSENVRNLAYTAAYLELPGLLALVSETYSTASASAALHTIAWTADWIAQYDQHTEVYNAFSDAEDPDDAVALRLVSSANPTTESFFTFERQEDPPPQPAKVPVAPVTVSAEPRTAKKEGNKFASLFKRKKKTRPSAEADSATPASHTLVSDHSSKSVDTSRTTDTSHMNTSHIASTTIPSIHTQASTPPLFNTNTFNDAYASHTTDHSTLQEPAFQHATSVESTPLHRCVFEPKHLYTASVMESVRILHKRVIDAVAEHWGTSWMDTAFTKITQADQKHIVTATKTLIRSTVDTPARLPLSAHSEALIQKYRRVPLRSASAMNGSSEIHGGSGVSYGRSSSAMGNMLSAAEPIRRPSTSVGGSFDKPDSNLGVSTRLGNDSLVSSRQGSSLLVPDSRPLTSGSVLTGSSSRSASQPVPIHAEDRSHMCEPLTQSPTITLLSIVSGAQALSALISDTAVSPTHATTAQIVGPLYQEITDYLISFVLGDTRHIGALLSQTSSDDSKLTTYLSQLLCRAVTARNAVAFYDFCVRKLETTGPGSVATVVLTPVLEHVTTFIRRRYPTIASESRDASITFDDLRPEDLNTLSKAIGVDSDVLRGKQYDTQVGQQETTPLSEATESHSAVPEEPRSRTPHAKLEFFASPRARPSSEYYSSHSHLTPEAAPASLLHPASEESRFLQTTSHPQLIKLRHRKSYSEDVRAKNSESQTPSKDAHAKERAFQKLQRSRLSYSPALSGTDSPLSQQPVRQMPPQNRSTSGTSATSSPVSPSISSLRNMFEEDEDTSFTSVSSGISKSKVIKQRGGAGSESGSNSTRTGPSNVGTSQPSHLHSSLLRTPRSINATLSASANPQTGSTARSKHLSLTESDLGQWNAQNPVSAAKSHRSNYSGRSTPVGSGVSSVSSVSTAINAFSCTSTVGGDTSGKFQDAPGAIRKHVGESSVKKDDHSSALSSPGLATSFSPKTPTHTSLRSASPSLPPTKTSLPATSPRLFEPKADLKCSSRKVPASWQSNASASPRATRTSTPGSPAASSRVRDMINSINQKANGGVNVTPVGENALRDAPRTENSNNGPGWPDFSTRLTDASNFVPPKSVRRTSMLSFSSNSSVTSLLEGPRVHTPVRPISPNLPLRGYKRQSIGGISHDSEDEQNRAGSRYGLASHLTPSENGSLQTRKSSSSIRVIASTNSRVTLGSKPVLSSHSAVSDDDGDDVSILSWSEDDEGPAQARTRQWAGSQQILSDGPGAEDDDTTIKIPQGLIVGTASGTVATMAGSLTGKSVAGSVDFRHDSTQTITNLSYSKQNRNSILSETSDSSAEILGEHTGVDRPSHRVSESRAPGISDNSANSVDRPLLSSRSPSGVRNTSYALSNATYTPVPAHLLTKTRQHLVEIPTPPAGLRLNAGIPCVVRVLESIVVKAHIKYLGYVYGNLLDSAEETDPATILRHKSAVELVGVSVNKQEMESKLGTHLEQLPILLDGVYKHVRYFVPNEAGERSNASGRSRRVLSPTLEKQEDLSYGLFVLPPQIIYVL